MEYSIQLQGIVVYTHTHVPLCILCNVNVLVCMLTQSDFDPCGCPVSSSIWSSPPLEYISDICVQEREGGGGGEGKGGGEGGRERKEVGERERERVSWLIMLTS